MTNPYWHEITAALNLPETPFVETGAGELPSVFGVSDFASATLAAAGTALAALADRGADAISVDRRLASLWFDMTLVADGWELPSIWDPIAGVYATRDGFIRLHTNAPHHREAALNVLDCAASREAVTARVAEWSGETLETAIVAAKGCAARLRSRAEWLEHPQGIAVRCQPLIRWHPAHQSKPMPLADGDAPLAGLKVLDLTRVLAGPVASRFLAGFGAKVLRIDPPHWNEPAAEAEVNLGKSCAGLDLTKADDRSVFETLLQQADLLLHGYRPGALEGLGYGPEARAKLNPTLTDVSLSAYGRSGPWAGRRGFDSLVQMSCGIASEGQRLTKAGAPVPLPVQALDHGTGYLIAAAALRALGHRTRGEICRAELSLARTAETLMASAGTMCPDETVQLTQDDLNPEVENTGWGPARRVRAPLRLGGKLPIWPVPSGPVRRHVPRWG